LPAPLKCLIKADCPITAARLHKSPLTNCIQENANSSPLSYKAAGMDRHGFLPVGHAQTERPAAATPHCPTPCANDLGVRGSGFRCRLGQYRSCIVMMHDSVPSRKVATSERPRTSNQIHRRQTLVAEQDKCRAHGVSGLVSGPASPLKRNSTPSLDQTQFGIDGHPAAEESIC